MSANRKVLITVFSGAALIAAIVVSSAMLPGSRVPAAGAYGISTRIYSGLERNAGRLNLDALAKWAGDHRRVSRARDLERQVAQGEVVKLFLHGENGPVDQDALISAWFNSKAKRIRSYYGTSLDPSLFECPESETPSYSIYLHHEDQAAGQCH